MRLVRTTSLLVAALAFLIAAGQPAGAATIDWPQFRFDDHHTGFNPFETVLNKSLSTDLDTVQILLKLIKGAYIRPE